MSKLSKVKLPSAIVLEEQEMKQVLGGSSSGKKCVCKCYNKDAKDPEVGSYLYEYPSEYSCMAYCEGRLGSSYGRYTYTC